MSLFHYFVLATLTGSAILVILNARKLRERLTNMHAMIIAMVMGMNIGLTAGVLFGSLYQGDLYSSTLISIAVGAIGGIACGISFGTLSSIEGFMSGLMGGMMGAMLGEMISHEQSTVMLNILLTLTTSSLLLFYILPNSKGCENKVSKKSWFLKPLLTFVLLLSFLLFGNQLDNNLALSDSSISDKHNHGNQNDSKLEEAQNVILNVHPSDFSYSPSEIIVEKNQATSITLNNHDQIDHDIEIKNISFQESSNSQHTEHTTGGADFHLHASANSSADITFTPTKTGIYEFYCTIPGHKESGMTGKLIVK
ncbi:plastocyanin/azurin family copper-binding protein [Cytobacillus gottheilii]|uniref:plastocyanin/azurin family copper-binding protein n=1 Tax=Cytobacillus gottheilii TaxID=859144 RepID=UPI002494BA46|nr:plastocyanin/azurin family copper-binding protein [Cytobacillus gottheilii]